MGGIERKDGFASHIKDIFPAVAIPVPVPVPVPVTVPVFVGCLPAFSAAGAAEKQQTLDAFIRSAIILASASDSSIRGFEAHTLYFNLCTVDSCHKILSVYFDGRASLLCTNQVDCNTGSLF